MNIFDYSFRNCIVRNEGGKNLLGQFIDAQMQANAMENSGEREGKHRKIPMRDSHTNVQTQ